MSDPAVLSATPDSDTAPRTSVGSRRIAWDISVQLVGRLGNLALGVVVTGLIARALGSSDFGILAAIGAILGLSAVLFDFGFDQVAVRRASVEPEREPEWLAALFSLRLAASFASFVVGVLLLVGISRSNEMLVAGLVLALPMLTTAFSSLRVVFQLRVENTVTIGLLSMRSVVWAGIVVAIYVWGGGLLAVAVGSATVAIVMALLTSALAVRRGRMRFSKIRPQCREMLRVGVPLGIGGLLVLGYARIDQLLVFELAGSRDAGFYAAAYKIFDQSSFAPIAISTTLFPLLAASAAVDLARFKLLLQTSLELLVAAAAGSLAIAIAYSGPIVRLVYGHDFGRAAPAVPVLMGAFVLVSLGYLQDILIVITNQQKRLVVVAALALAVNVALNVTLIPVWGFMAAAAITVATEAVAVVLRWHVLRRHLPAQPGAGRIPRVLLASTALLVGLVGLRALSVSAVPALLLACAAYPVLLFASRAVSRDDVRLVLGRGRLANEVGGVAT